MSSPYKIAAQIPASAPISGTGLGEPSASDAVRKRPIVNLFTNSSYTAPVSATANGNSAIALPGLSSEDAQKAQLLFADIDPDKQTAINAASGELGAALFQQMQASLPKAVNLGEPDPDTGEMTASSATSGAKNISRVSTGAPAVAVNSASPSVVAATSNATAAYSAASPGQSYDNQIIAVSTMAVTGLQNEMDTYARGVGTRLEQRKTLSADQTELTQAVADWPKGTEDQPQTFTLHTLTDGGGMTTETVSLTKEQAKAKADGIESTVTAMQDQNSIDQLKLQNMSQNYTNAVSTISNLMKVAFDNVKNTIGNLRG